MQDMTSSQRPQELKPAQGTAPEAKPSAVKPNEVKPPEPKPLEVKPTQGLPTEAKPVQIVKPSPEPSTGAAGQPAGMPTEPKPIPALPQVASPFSVFGQTRNFEFPPPLPPEALPDPTNRPTEPFAKSLPWVIEFRIVGTSDILQIQVRDTLLMGRADFERNINPEIDLSAYNAAALGVSRRHAMITVKDTWLMIQDLGSTNGTRLNDQTIEPLIEYRIRHDDVLTLGGLQLKLQYAVVPAEMATKPQTAPLTYDATIPNVGKGQRVLVIEDDDNVGEVFRRGLEIAGFKVTLVRTVMQGLGLCFHQMPDAIIINAMVSDMNALDLVQYIRKVDKGHRVPVVVVSPTSGGFYKNQALQAGADLFMGKPVAMEDLVRAIGKAFV
ncbi:MAG: response regulator [Anaerolineae bacterium]